MTMLDERPQPRQAAAPWQERGLAWAAVAAFGAIVLVLWLWWPLGVVLGLAAAVLVTLWAGQRMHTAALATPISHSLTAEDDDLRQEFRRLRVRLGDDWSEFSSAVVVVTRRQSASAAALRQELGVSTAQAQHLLQLLEREGFVGPAQGTRARQVRVAPEHADQLLDLLHA